MLGNRIGQGAFEPSCVAHVVGFYQKCTIQIKEFKVSAVQVFAKRS